MIARAEVGEPARMCRCGGRFRLDTQFLADAERLGFDSAVLLWTCFMCGRPRWTGKPSTLKRPAARQQ